MDDQWADEFGLNYAQMRYVQDAVPGNGMLDSPRRSSASTVSGAGSRSRQCPRRSKSSTSTQPSNGGRHFLALARRQSTQTLQEFREELEERVTNGQSKESETVSAKPDGGSMEGRTMREYLRVTPTSEGLDSEGIPRVFESLHKLATAGSTTGLAQKLNPLHSETPLRFEFLALEWWRRRSCRVLLRRRRASRHTRKTASFDLSRDVRYRTHRHRRRLSAHPTRRIHTRRVPRTLRSGATTVRVWSRRTA